MKKKISVLAAVLLAFGLAACGNNAAQAAYNSGLLYTTSDNHEGYLHTLLQFTS